MKRSSTSCSIGLAGTFAILLGCASHHTATPAPSAAPAAPTQRPFPQETAPTPAAAPAPATAAETPDSLAHVGKARFQSYKCYECHGASGEGTNDGPDLTGTRLSAEQIADFLRHPSPDARSEGMPSIPAGSPDLQALVAYVVSLKRPSAPR